MQTDAISSQPVTRLTPVTKLALPISPALGKENFESHIALAVRNEKSEESKDMDSEEPEGDSGNEEPESAEFAETQPKNSEGLPLVQLGIRDVSMSKIQYLDAVTEEFGNVAQSSHITKENEYLDKQSIQDRKMLVDDLGMGNLQPTINETAAKIGSFSSQPLNVGQLGISGSASVLIASQNIQRLTERELNPSRTESLKKSKSPMGLQKSLDYFRPENVKNTPQVSSGASNFGGVTVNSQLLARFQAAQTLTADTAVLHPTPLFSTVAVAPPEPNVGLLSEPNSYAHFSDPRSINSSTSPANRSNSFPAERPMIAGRLADGLFVQPLEIGTEPFLQEGDLAEGTSLLSTGVSASNRVDHSAVSALSLSGTARAVAIQMVDALSNAQRNRIEIALSPEELGRVRMVLSTTDAGISVSILAERPETLDLMRRHIDQLTEEFRNLGYVDISFEFSGEKTNSNFDDRSEGRQESTDTEPDDNPANPQLDPETTHYAHPSALRGLDMRL